MTQALRVRICRVLLFAALLPTGFLTVALFGTGIWFSPLEQPVAAVLALMLALAPIWVFRTIILSADEERARQVTVHTIGIWSAIAFYGLFVSGVLPKPIYDGWGWLVS